MKLPRRNFLHLAAGAAALPAFSRIARAQAYPSRPVRFVVGAPAGGFLIGLGLDALFGTRPVFMLLLLFFGFGVGIRNVMRISKTPPGSNPGAGS